MDLEQELEKIKSASILASQAKEDQPNTIISSQQSLMKGLNNNYFALIDQYGEVLVKYKQALEEQRKLSELLESNKDG